MKIQNLSTGEVVNVSNTIIRNGRIEGRYQFGTRYFNKYGKMLQKIGDSEDGQRPILQLADGWQVVATKDEPQPKPKTKEEPTKDEQPEAVEVVAEPVAVDEPAKVAEAEDTTDETNEQALIAAIKNLRGGAVDMAKVREIVREEFARLAADDAKKAAKVLKVIAKVAKKEGQVYHDNFEDVKARIARGQWVYLYGPTGSGKNVLAEQIAEALGLPFHYQAHCSDRFELTGFIDANGNYQPTEFYKAYTEGGLFMLDELDASDENALITLNSAANGYFAFPCGTVRQHPDFRCIAAGNTCGRGATDDYTGRRVMDISSIGRFVPRFHNYLTKIDLHEAEGNQELVDFIHVMRDAKRTTGAQIIASPRQIKTIIADEKDGLNLTQTLTDVFAAYLTEDDLNIVKQFVKNDGRMSGNKYAKAFAKVQAVVY